MESDGLLPFLFSILKGEGIRIDPDSSNASSPKKPKEPKSPSKKEIANNKKLSSIQRSFAMGDDTFVLCPTEESDLGYYVALVMEILTGSDQKQDAILKLKWLVPQKGFENLTGKTGCPYILKKLYDQSQNQTTKPSEEIIWESESNVKLLQFTKLRYDRELGHIYCLMEDISIKPLSSSSSSETLASLASQRNRSLSDLLFNFEVIRMDKNGGMSKVSIEASSDLVGVCEDIEKAIINRKESVCNQSQINWDHRQIDGVQIWDRKDSPLPFFQMIGQTKVKSTACEMYLHLLNAKNRKKVDSQLKSINILQNIGDSTTIVSLTECAWFDPFGFTGRQFYFLTEGRVKSDKNYVVTVNSVEWEGTKKDKEVGILIDSGWVIEQRDGYSLVTYSLNLNLGGVLHFFSIKPQLIQDMSNVLKGLQNLAKS